MPEISYTGAFNANVLNVPDLYINVQLPASGAIQPATYGLVALEGVASWGPVDRATLIGNPAQLNIFGTPKVRLADLPTHSTIILQAQQAAGIGANLLINRVTDGTDAAASANLGSIAASTETATLTGTLNIGDVLDIIFTSASITDSPVTASYTTKTGDSLTAMAAGLAAAINANAYLQAANVSATSALGVVTIYYPTALTVSFSESVTGSSDEVITLAAGSASTINGMTLTSLYTGSGGNGASWTISRGSNSTTAVPTWRLTLQQPNLVTETYDNLGAGLSGIALWTALVAAVNSGSSPIRGPSLLTIASAGVAPSSNAPAASTGSLSGGSDGGVPTAANFIGVDTAGARTGIFVFRNSGATDCLIADFDTVAHETDMIAFGSSEGIYVHTAGPPGETPTAGQTAKQTTGSYSQWLKRYLGDWCYWNDNLNGVQRLISPATFGAALLSTLQPQMSGTNKPVVACISTQRSTSGSGPYGTDELAVLESSGIDVITNPIPSGPMFGMRLGLNASANPVTLNDAWPRLTSFLARSLAGPGALGTLIGQLITPSFYQEGYDMLDAFLAPMKASTAGNAQMINNYQITFDAAHNPQAQATGVVIAQVLIQYLQEARVFLVNMMTGATVVIPATGNVSAAVASLAAA